RLRRSWRAPHVAAGVPTGGRGRARGRAPGRPGSADRARGGAASWQLAQHGLAEPNLEQEDRESGPGEPGIELAVVEVLGRLERGLLGLVDLGVDVAEALGVGGAEVLTASRRRHLLQRVLVDVDRHRTVDLVAERILHGIGREPTRAGADGVDLD